MSSKAATSKTTKSAKKPAKRATVASLASDLKALETRLKRSQTTNRKAIKDIEELVTGLTSSASKTSPAQKAALTRGLNALEKKLRADLDKATQYVRAEIRSDLASAAGSGADMDMLQVALDTAHVRLEVHETSQRESIARLNRHIADLATAVDARLSAESKARRTDMADVMKRLSETESQIGKRIDRVEDDTAAALNRIGDKVAEFAAVLDERAHKSDAETAERLADLAQETQAEFNHAQTDVTTRLEALETIAAEWTPPSATPALMPANLDDPRIDQMSQTLGQLQDEISRLHARLASVQSAPAKEPQTNVVPMARPSTQPVTVTPLPTLRDDNPYAAAYQVPAPETSRDSHVPVEFDPTAFQPTGNDQATNYAGETQISESLPEVPPLPDMPPQLPPMASLGSLPAQIPQMPENALAAPQPVETYSNPAYADQDEMRAERITGDSPKKRSLPALPISGRNLRVGALTAGVAVVGLVAAKSILGGESAPVTQPQAQNTAPIASVEENSASELVMFEPVGLENGTGEEAPVTSTPPLGTYSETATPQIADGQQNTLAAAVAAGNPIAQFQLGLNKLQAGEPEEAARLIRLAANRNQPAAQYRLAKLYETGTGVAKDPVTARELVERAAIGGNRIAMHDLGNYHFYGQGGLERDPAVALDWFTKAAERGVVDSQFNVAFLREGGQGVAEDLSVAYFWYNIAARQGDQGAPGRIAAIGPQLDEATRTRIEADAGRFNPKPVDEAANGLFRDVPWAAKPAKPVDAGRAARIVKIKTAQTLLTDLGFEIGGADGAAGPKTRAAVREFQKVNGLAETGEITDDLIERLEIAAGA